MNECEITVPCSKIALVETGLSFIKEVKNKIQFSIALVNGLGQHLEFDFREIFAKQIFEWMREPEPPMPLKCYYNTSRDMMDTYVTNPNANLEDVSNGIPLVLTGQVSQTLDCLRTWLKEGNEQHFLMVGNHGSAKT